jgi:hypothetical protein
MTMTVKTMEFDTIIVTYDYTNQTLTVKAKPAPEVTSATRVHRLYPEGEVKLPSFSIQELREGLEGIGQQVPSGRR